MENKLPTSFITAGILILGLSSSCLAGDIPKQVDINTQASNPAVAATSKDSKTVPAFSHAKHATTILENNSNHVSRPHDKQFTCTACHVGVKNEEDILSESAKQSQADEVKKAGGVKKHMHALCLDCHKSMKKANLATGPTSCKGCHKPQ